MSRLEGRLAACRAADRKALTAFITAGDPVPSATVPALHALVRGGADILELGVPFSDPEAEGPPVQRSSERALRNGVTLAGVLAMAEEFRREDTATPVVLMGYLNSIMRMGYDRFAGRAAAAGVDGMIVVNLPPEEAAAAREAFRARDLDLVFLVAPTTTTERAARIAGRASGFLYYVSLKGVTGARHLDVEDVARNLKRLRQVCDLPIQVGFGIRDAASARAVSRFADGVVVGSALVDIMGAGADDPETIPPRLERWLLRLREAMDAR